jgi:hypothetical protein
MDLVTVRAFSDELTKVGGEAIRRTVRRARVATEFLEPPAEGVLGYLAAKGLGARSPKRLAAAGAIGLAHGTLRKARQYAG